MAKRIRISKIENKSMFEQMAHIASGKMDPTATEYFKAHMRSTKSKHCFSDNCNVQYITLDELESADYKLPDGNTVADFCPNASMDVEQCDLEPTTFDVCVLRNDIERDDGLFLFKVLDWDFPIISIVEDNNRNIEVAIRLGLKDLPEWDEFEKQYLDFFYSEGVDVGNISPYGRMTIPFMDADNGNELLFFNPEPDGRSIVSMLDDNL